MSSTAAASRGGGSSVVDGGFTSVRSLCNLDRLDALLQGVLSKVNEHDEKLLKVSDEVRGRALSKEIGLANASLAKHMQSLSNKIASIQREVSFSSSSDAKGTGNATIGGVVARHGAHLHKISRILGEKATRAQLDSVSADVASRLQTFDTSIAEKLATSSDVEEMRIVVQDTLSQLSSLEERVARKLDKVELDHLHAAIARIKRFARFQDESSSRLEHLEKTNQESARRIQTLEAQMSNIMAAVANHQEQMVPRNEFDALSRRLTRLGDAFEMRTKASAKTMHTLDEVLADTAARARSLEASMSSMQAVDETSQKDIAQCLAACNAASHELVKKVDVPVAEEMWRELKKGLGEKAAVSTLNDARNDIASLWTAHTSLEDKIEVALRFVEWFSERGFAFEQNYDAIDRQLRSLSKTSVDDAKTRPPFDGPFRARGASVRLGKSSSDDPVSKR